MRWIRTGQLRWFHERSVSYKIGSEFLSELTLHPGHSSTPRLQEGVRCADTGATEWRDIPRVYEDDATAEKRVEEHNHKAKGE